MAQQYEICYITRYHGKSFTRCGVYNLSKEQAEVALRRAQSISKKYYFIRQHPVRQHLNLSESYLNEN